MPAPDPDELIMRHTVPRSCVLDIAIRIEMAFGTSGATFPGAAELYEAVEKINAWHKLWKDGNESPSA